MLLLLLGPLSSLFSRGGEEEESPEAETKHRPSPPLLLMDRPFFLKKGSLDDDAISMYCLCLQKAGSGL